MALQNHRNLKTIADLHYLRANLPLMTVLLQTRRLRAVSYQQQFGHSFSYPSQAPLKTLAICWIFSRMMTTPNHLAFRHLCLQKHPILLMHPFPPWTHYFKSQSSCGSSSQLTRSSAVLSLPFGSDRCATPCLVQCGNLLFAMNMLTLKNSMWVWTPHTTRTTISNGFRVTIASLRWTQSLQRRRSFLRLIGVEFFEHGCLVLQRFIHIFGAGGVQAHYL